METQKIIIEYTEISCIPFKNDDNEFYIFCVSDKGEVGRISALNFPYYDILERLNYDESYKQPNIIVYDPTKHMAYDHMIFQLNDDVNGNYDNIFEKMYKKSYLSLDDFIESKNLSISKQDLEKLLNAS